MGPRPTKVLYDGTSLWVLRTQQGVAQHTLVKVALDDGEGYGGTPVRNGLLMHGKNGDIYCVYIDTAGTLQASTSMASCEN